MNFKKYSTSDNQWHDIPYYQHKTATDTLTLPAVIYPNDTSITVGIYGNTVQNGTPTPQNPVDVNGTGERTANLFDPNGVTTNERGETRVGVELPAGAYCVTNLSNAACYWRIGVETQTGNQINPSAPYAYINAPDTLVVWVGGNSNKNIMLNLGSTPLPYEPYGYKIPISCGGTTTPIYLGEVETTRRVKKLVLTGEETETELKMQSTNNFYVRTTLQYNYNVGKCMCTHYVNHQVVNSEMSSGEIKQDVSSSFGTSTGVIVIKDTSYSTLADFKTYLAQQYTNGTPVTVWYVLATPTTGIVNEPLMKIGDYADSLTTSIPCTAGENTLDVQTTVQPSEVTAGFSGWHPVSAVHERENGQWD